MVFWNIFTAVWNILLPLGNLVAIWYIFSRFGILCQEKSGNPEFREQDILSDILAAQRNHSARNGSKKVTSFFNYDADMGCVEYRVARFFCTTYQNRKKYTK
jgi:hypothetical protein